MRSPRLARLVATVAALLAVALLAASCSHKSDENPVTTTTTTPLAAAVSRTGKLPDGADWKLQAPKDWNGTLLLYSHGLVGPGRPNPARIAPEDVVASVLLRRGYALVGTSYPATGWVLAAAAEDQIAALDLAERELGKPKRTIAWGGSMGGLLTVGLLELHPDRFDGGLSLCGALAGADVIQDSFLDVMFVVKTLIAPNVTLTGFDDDGTKALDALRAAGTPAQASAQGRARLALAAAVGAIPGWADLTRPRPAATAYLAQEQAQLQNLALIGQMGTVYKAALERLVGGNPATNVGVDYAALLQASPSLQEVRALYERAGLDLSADLAKLAAAPRVQADPAARQALITPIHPTGALQDPLLTLHTTGDGLVAVQQERAFGDLVAQAGTQALLRQTSVDRAGHCIFSVAEEVVAVDTITQRASTGAWPTTSAAALDRRAGALGADLNVVIDVAGGTGGRLPARAAFLDAQPSPFPRFSRTGG